MVLDRQHVNDCKTKQQDFCSDDKKKLTKEKEKDEKGKILKQKKRRINYIERSVVDNFLINFFFFALIK